ncbi:MAG: hypothetical protein V2A34_11705, partial [Lentisphaerota bacterium]
LRAVEVECLPTDILAHVDLDVSALSIGDSLSIGDIKLDAAKFTIISDKHLAVATVAAPRAEEEVKPEEAVAGEAAAGPEVITEKKLEDGEAAPAEEGKKGGKEEPKKAAGGKEEAKEEPKKGKEKK